MTSIASTRTLRTLAKPYRKQLALSGVLALGSSLLMLAIPWLAASMLGGIVSREIVSKGSTVGLLFGVLVALALTNFATANLSGATAARLLADLRMRVYSHVQGLPIAFHESHRQGDTLALMTYEVARLSNFLTSTLVVIPARILTVVGAAFLMFRVDPKLALVVPLIVPAFYVIIKLIGRRLRGLARSIQQAEANVMAIAEENLEMLPAIKAFTREEFEVARYRARIDGALMLSIDEKRIYAALEPMIGLAAAAAAVCLLMLAGQSVQAGTLAPTALFSLLFYSALLTRPIGALAHIYGQLQTGFGTLARLQTVLEIEQEAGYLPRRELMRVKGEIIFSNVHFAYPGREPTLAGIDLHIRPGEIIALTGLNGAGKSTLAKLLLGFYAVDKGHILLDGHDIAGLNVQSLRRQIGLVAQRVLLFNGSIRDNIAYGLVGASDTEIEQASRLAQAWDFVSELPEGFDTQIGDHGVRLSGGQQQRIALARALVKDPPILILDEATSMYDLEGERAFVDSCTTALHGRTVIIITHRPESLAIADRVWSIEDGKALLQVSSGQSTIGQSQ